MNEDQAKALRAPFPKAAIGQVPKPYQKNAEKGRCPQCKGWHGLPAAHLDYVGHAATTDRLLQVDPEWSWEPFAVDPRGLPARDENGNLWIRLTVAGVTRIGVGDGASAKEAIGDAIRNAAMRFGVALDLWAKEDLHAVDVERGSQVEPAQRDPREAAFYARAEGKTRDPYTSAREEEEHDRAKAAMFAAFDRSPLFPDEPRTDKGRAHRLAYIGKVVGREVASTNELMHAEFGKVLDALRADEKDLTGGDPK